MLASHHEKIAESAPSEASCKSPVLEHLSQQGRVLIGIASTQAAAPAESSSSGEKAKKEPVTKRDHLDTAADLMSDIQVETYSSMDKREKTEL
jgi:26S proteasome regulatory subunit N5